LFEKNPDVQRFGLAKLFEAEQIETLRKDGDAAAALHMANALAEQLAHAAAPDTDLEHYGEATASYLLGNFLRSAGRYDSAMKFIAKAESTYRPNIQSHATELAHCFYAKQVCVAMTGTMSFSPSYPLRSEASERFAGALIELSYSHAAWFLDDIRRAIAHANRASERFESAGTRPYARRARNLYALLSIWKALTEGTEPVYEALDNHYRRGLMALLKGDEDDHLRSWFAQLRPSVAVGVLQMARDFSAHFERTAQIKLPRTLEPDDCDWKWRWSVPTTAHSLSEADKSLRQSLGIPPDRRIPLIAD
jgi:tetratricopeptide (TPR) repeat protein